MKIKATYLLYPNAVRVSSAYGAFDSDGNQIAVDEAAVAAKAAELEIDQQWEELRRERNRLIAETDYLALSDATLSEDMRTYRQALRDLPDNTSDPANPTWPVKPS
jgi:DnaJ-domain-containing protein 1